MQLLRDKVLRETYMCSKVCGMISRGELRENHPQQRKSGQWSTETRDNFIATVIMNWDFDPIKICEQLSEDEGVILWLIDGLQRSTTISDFKAGKFKLGRNIDPYIIEYQITEKDENGKTVNKNIEYDLRGKSYVDLPEKLKEDFDNCPVMVVKHLDCTDEEIGRHIVRYNSGSKMVPGQKLVTYMPKTANKIKELSSHAFFNDCANYSDALDKNGKIEQTICESLLFTYMSEKWTRTTKKIATLIEENITEDTFDRCINQMDRLLNIITPEKGEYFSTKNALLWFRLFNEFSNLGLEDSRFVDFLNDFGELKNKKFKLSKSYTLNKGTSTQKEIDELSFAELDSLSSSKDKGLLTDKFYILETLMMEYLHINKEETQSEETENVSDIEENNESVEPVNKEEFIAELVDMSVEEVKANIGDYEEDLDTLEENAVKIDSKLRDDDNRLSLLAMVAYSYKHDIDLDDWLEDYAAKNNTYFMDQRKNYSHMVNDFNLYQKRIAVA